MVKEASQIIYRSLKSKQRLIVQAPASERSYMEELQNAEISEPYTKNEFKRIVMQKQKSQPATNAKMGVLLNRPYYYMGDIGEIKLQMHNNLCATPIRKYHFELERTIRATDFIRRDTVLSFDKQASCDKYKEEEIKFSFDVPLGDENHWIEPNLRYPEDHQLFTNAVPTFIGQIFRIEY